MVWEKSSKQAFEFLNALGSELFES